MNTVMKARAAIAASSAKLRAIEFKVAFWRAIENMAIDLIVRRETAKLALLDEGIVSLWALEFGLDEESILLADEEED